MVETKDLAARIAAESATLSPDKQSTVLDFILFVKERAGNVSPEDGDAAWERIINHPSAYPKLEAFAREASQEGEEPFDLERL